MFVQVIGKVVCTGSLLIRYKGLYPRWLWSIGERLLPQIFLWEINLKNIFFSPFEYSFGKPRRCTICHYWYSILDTVLHKIISNFERRRKHFAEWKEVRQTASNMLDFFGEEDQNVKNTMLFHKDHLALCKVEYCWDLTRKTRNTLLDLKRKNDLIMGYVVMSSSIYTMAQF